MSLVLRASRQTSLSMIMLLGCLALGCVAGELRSMETAQREYDDCVLEYSAEDPDCKALHERLLQAQDRYGENSRRAWSCDPMSEECPTRR